MAGSHSTLRGVRAAALNPSRGSERAQTRRNIHVADASAEACSEQVFLRLPLRPVRPPVTVPFRHSGPEIAHCVGALIAELRRSVGLSREEAAWRAWITPRYWYVLECGNRVPSIAVFVMLARSLGLDPRELLDRLLEKIHYGRGAPPVPEQEHCREYGRKYFRPAVSWLDGSLLTAGSADDISNHAP